MSDQYYIPSVQSQYQKQAFEINSHQSENQSAFSEKQTKNSIKQQKIQFEDQPLTKQQIDSILGQSPKASTRQSNNNNHQQQQQKKKYNILKMDNDSDCYYEEKENKIYKKQNHYLQNNSQQFQDQYKPTDFRPQSAQSNVSFASQISQKHRQGQQGLLNWDIIKTQHKTRNPKEKYQKKQFLTANPNQRDQTDKQYKGTKIDTCSKIVVQNGVVKAIPSFKKPPKNSFQKSQQLGQTQSFNKQSYGVTPTAKAGDRKKPLGPYNPNASRNKLPSQEFKKPYRNDSQIQLGSNDKDKKRYLSTKQNMQSYKNPNFYQTQNPAINAYRTTWYKNQEQK
ncbi:hypothetical protein PPERSA_01005 [Pseudocohnilembus persalinus]|uniref:Uncharacterized protein n=1 Tax=Pseudocohnilembus persalinus TaxID=266149 RepID=A0A0V0QUL0_PSEPJ|nr:hypothetical protein PPERSA_01005 [Pseudocohnilembus persalinus]|eukprot:KRX05927.1 hypothetical protein PPERSA_01005 [Pseudocohnilembus persalinus]